MRTLLLTLTVIFTSALLYGQGRLSKLKRVEIQFSEVTGARQYEIEWFKTKQTTTADKACYRKVQITSSPFRGLIPRECEFFRIRSIADEAGDWSTVHAIPKLVLSDQVDPVNVFFSEVDKGIYGKVLYLKGDKLDLNRFSKERPLYYSLNGSEIAEYKPHLEFKEEKEYHLKVYTKNADDGKYILLHDLKFRVDLTKPQSDISMYPPFYYDNGLFWFGEKTGVRLWGKDLGSGIDGFYFRLQSGDELKRKLVQPPFIRQKELNRLEKLLKSAYIEKSGQLIQLEYFAVDRSGNQEAPKKLRFKFDLIKPEVKKVGNTYYIKDISDPVTVEITAGGQKLYEGLALGTFRISDEIQKKINEAISTPTIKFSDKLGNSVSKTLR